MSALPRLVALLLAAAPLAACSSGAASPDVTPDAQVSAEDDIPPKLITGGVPRVPFTVMVVGDSRSPSQARTPRSWTMTVQVDSTGQADPGSLVVTGLTGDDLDVAYRTMEHWLKQVSFEPARRGGVAVPGTYRRTFQR